MTAKSILLGMLLLPFFSIAQNLYLNNNLATENLLDSAYILLYQKKIDTHRIKIEINHVSGYASFYSTNLDSTLTATGEIFLNRKFTAASNIYKLNSIVRVTNLRNGRSVLVRINDRMHSNMLKKGRVIDLSQAASKRIRIRSIGVERVVVDGIRYDKSNPKRP
jgi:rare lipoprotein A (peptidoglycan hydrolase)